MGRRSLRYVKTDKTPFYKKNDPTDRLGYLLWGDRVKVDLSEVTNGKAPAAARGWEGHVKVADLGEESLLEIYFIDVGQGDGVLIKCPDPNKTTLGRHIMIDGGYRRSRQPTCKSGADFVDWKFYKEYDMDEIVIDDLICSHCDADHYGGLWDLVNADETDELDTSELNVARFSHAGCSWWRTSAGASRSLGRKANGQLIDLISDRASILDGLDKTSYPQLQGEWADFLESLTADQPNTDIRLIGYEAGSPVPYLEGYEPGQSDVEIQVLGPVLEQNSVNSGYALKSLSGTHSINTNGHSVTLKLQYGRARFLMTGDLNKASMIELLTAHAGHREVFLSDVTKACHHGSEDIHYKFLQAINASATVISSGDNEAHSHPRPNVLAMSATSGHQTFNDEGELDTPLIYSTEIARSIKIGQPTELLLNEQYDADPSNDRSFAMGAARIKYEVQRAGDINPKKSENRLKYLKLVGGIIYGLVNVRTDGERILFAVRDEKSHDWEIKVINARF